MISIHPNVRRIERDIQRLSAITDPLSPGFTRISFSAEDKKARQLISGWMEREAGLAVRIDAAGNLIGRREGRMDGPVFMMGSHIDTVPAGGRFDGMAGVSAALEVVRRFEELGVNTVYPIEVAIFLAEEPSPFGISTIGSRGMRGKLSAEKLQDLKDQRGRPLSQAIAEMGGAPDELLSAIRKPGEIRTYLELHIEQGPVLESKGIDIGVVTGITGIHRGKIHITGRPDHAGTTPMGRRRDALTAAAEVILAVEGACRGEDALVGTVGKVEINPNASNVVPGAVDLDVEIRSPQSRKIKAVRREIAASIAKIRAQRDVAVDYVTWGTFKPMVFDPQMVSKLGHFCDQLGISHLNMPSMAGHDASHIAEIAPTGMLFIPSKNGRSHCPEEWSDVTCIAKGADVMARCILSDQQ